MIEKIIDFVSFPFILISDLIDTCRCKHSWRLVYSESDDKHVYQSFICRKCGTYKTKIYAAGDEQIVKLRYCALVKKIHEFYMEHPYCYEAGLGTYPFKLSEINDDGTLTGPFYAIRGIDEYNHVIVDCPVIGYSPDVADEYKIPSVVFKNCFAVVD